MNENNTKLKPCPFCGGESEIECMGTGRVSMIYACTMCGCRLETGETFLVEECAWNRRASGWIPVTEKPMPLNEVVLIFMRNFSKKPECAIRYFAGTKECLDGFSFTSEIRSVSDVTHWQPLPEPPKEESKK